MVVNDDRPEYLPSSCVVPGCISLDSFSSNHGWPQSSLVANSSTVYFSSCYQPTQRGSGLQKEPNPVAAPAPLPESYFPAYTSFLLEPEVFGGGDLPDTSHIFSHLNTSFRDFEVDPIPELFGPFLEQWSIPEDDAPTADSLNPADTQQTEVTQETQITQEPQIIQGTPVASSHLPLADISTSCSSSQSPLLCQQTRSVTSVSEVESFTPSCSPGKRNFDFDSAETSPSGDPKRLRISHDFDWKWDGYTEGFDDVVGLR